MPKCDFNKVAKQQYTIKTKLKKYILFFSKKNWDFKKD